MRQRTKAEMLQGWASRALVRDAVGAGGVKLPTDHAAGEAEGTASRTGFAKSRIRKAERGATLPTSGLAPKPPPVMVLYDDVADPEQLVLERVGVRQRRGVPVYGQYPRTLIARMLPWLGCARHEVLHVCSGSLPPGEGIRVDIRPEAHPDILADGRALPFRDGSIAAVMIDPPYTEHYAKELYGVKYPRPSHLLREAVRVVRPGGRIVFVHYITPKPPPGARFVKAFGLSTGFDMPIRAVSVFGRHGATLDIEVPA